MEFVDMNIFYRFFLGVLLPLSLLLNYGGRVTADKFKKMKKSGARSIRFAPGSDWLPIVGDLFRIVSSFLFLPISLLLLSVSGRDMVDNCT